MRDSVYPSKVATMFVARFAAHCFMIHDTSSNPLFAPVAKKKKSSATNNHHYQTVDCDSNNGLFDAVREPLSRSPIALPAKQ
jgi:hypothetical protein